MYRYPGPSPFKEGMKDLYHGREEDVENLFNSLQLNNCTVIVGKSGIGKSSLINAGLVPLIEDNINNSGDDRRHFIIIRVRVRSYEPGQQQTLLNRFTQQVCAAFAEPVANPFLSFLEEGFRQSVGFILKQRQYDAFLEQRRVLFLFIFDQLEELFTYPFRQFEELEKELKELLNPNIPDAVRYQLENLKDRRSRISPKEAELLTIPLPVKFLFAIRADKLSLLIRLKEAISGVFGNIYELRPMNKEQAARAISEPAGKNGNYLSEPFAIDPEAIDYIISYLVQLPNSDPDYNSETLKIDPITIQIICRYIEQKIAPYDQDKIIKKHEIRDPEVIFTTYYEDTLQSIGLKPEELRQVKEFIESKMIYEPEKRRRQLFLDECGMSLYLMKKLVDSSLLREVPVMGGNSFYELSHDWLVPYVLHAKKSRLEAEQHNKDERLQTLVNNQRTVDNYSYDGFRLLKEKGDEFFTVKNYHDALVKYELAAEVKAAINEPLQQNEEIELFYARGECYFRLAQYDKSLLDLKHVLDMQPDHRLANFYSAYDYHMLGQLEIATSQYEKLLMTDPAYINAWFNSALIYSSMGNNEKAKENFKKVIELDANDVDGWYNLGVICNNLNEFEEAITDLTHAVKLKSDYTNAYIELAYSYSSKTPADFTHALECYDNILKYDSSNAKAYRSKATILNETGNTAEAEICLLKAASFDGTDYTAPYKLGIMASKAGHYTEAIKFFEKVLQINPAEKSALKNTLIEIGFAYMELKEYEKALKYYEQLLALDPEDAATYRELGIIYDNLNKSDLSVNNFLEAIKREPENDLFYFDLGITYHRFNKKEEAKECFLKQIALNASSENVSKSYNYLGYYALDSQNFDEALKYYQLALERVPKNSDYLYNLGLTYYKMNRGEEALQYFLKAVEINSEDSDAYYYIGELFEAQNNIPEAITAYQAVLRLHPNQEGINEKLKTLQQSAVNRQ